MYKNYGDKNFFEYGVLVDNDHSDTEIDIIRCLPYPEPDEDGNDIYQFNEMTVDITDEWIDRKAVMDFIGMTEDTFDPVQFAIGCTDWYSWDNFGLPYAYDWQRMDRNSICDILRHRMIASDGLDMPWLEPSEH